MRELATHIARAHELANRFPASRDVLKFYAQIAAFSGDRLALARHAPPSLRQALRDIDEASLKEATAAYLSGRDVKSSQAVVARLMLRLAPPKSNFVPASRCPRCGQPPQCAVLDTDAYALVCSLCQEEWPFTRGRCPACAADHPEEVYCYHAEEIPHIDTQVCEPCGRYVHLIHRDREPEAIPEVDELVALPLDVMCLDYGFVKLHPNLAGV